jgi:histidyl-tRNA synthetase
MAQLKYQRPTGTHDLYPGSDHWVDDSDRCALLEEVFRKLCHVYGYGEIRTPVFETTDLFIRSIGTGTDIVSKEMYTFTTKGDDSLTLRPESTAPVLRAYVQNALYARGGVSKLFYISVMSGPQAVATVSMSNWV